MTPNHVPSEQAGSDNKHSSSQRDPQLRAFKKGEKRTDIGKDRFDLEPTIIEKMSGLRWALGFDIFNSIFVQLTYMGSVFVLFLSELGMNKTSIGFMLALLPFAGLVSLGVAPRVARIGFKRAFMIFWTGRTIVTLPLLATPFIAARYGVQGVIVQVAIILLIFSVVRSTAMTALLPWQQEYIPRGIRGKYTAASNLMTSLAGLLAVTGASLLLDRSNGLNGYMVLFSIGILAGFISIWSASFVPGGRTYREQNHAVADQDQSHQPRKTTKENGEFSIPKSDSSVFTTLRDHRFLGYLVGAGVLTLATGPMFSFLPLFMQDKVGLSPGNVVLLQNGILLGGILTSFLWGWAADRFGSKPVMMSGLVLLATLPIMWLVMPRQPGIGLYVGFGISLLQGIASLGWGIGSGRLLYVSIVPTETKGNYLAMYNAWMGVIGGASKLIGGRVLDLLSGFSWQPSNPSLSFISIDSYAVLFLMGLVLMGVAAVVLQSLRSDTQLGVGKFAGMFFHGNPLLAMESMIQFRLAKDEASAVNVTERLGLAHSPLTVEELLEALQDPRFYVRFEAIVSIARSHTDPRLLEALINILNGPDPALGVIAAWALGRLGDPNAVQPLREALADTPYRSIRAHAARSLGTLGDDQVASHLIDDLGEEPDYGVKVAYASVLGKLRITEAAPALLTLLREKTEQGPFEDSRMEIALALARLVGDEASFIQMARNVKENPGVTLAQAVAALQKKLGDTSINSHILDTIKESTDLLARGEVAQGVAIFADMLAENMLTLIPTEANAVCPIILNECIHQIRIFGPARMEYILLTLFLLREV